MAEQQNSIPGQLEPGNIDLTKRPVVNNPDGSISTVRSLGVNIDGREVLIPTVSPDGVVLSDDDAIKLYEKSGQHLGIFDSPEHSTSYAESLHKDQDKMYSSNSSEIAPPEGVTFPWQMEWGKVSAEEPSNLAQESSPQVPWNMEWGKLPEINVEEFNQTMGYNAPTRFDTVFDKLIQAESRGRHRTSSGGLTTSPVGAQGITQVMPKTGRDPGYGVAPLKDNSEEEFIRFGRDYLKAMVEEFDGDMKKAVAAYNAGPASVKKAVVSAAKSGKDWTQHLPKKSETIPYIRKILGEG